VSTRPDPAGAQPFERERLTELLRGAEVTRRRRRRLQVALIGAALGILALGLPSERLWGDMGLVRLAVRDGDRSYGLLFPLAIAVQKLTGLRAEQAYFLIGAVAYGLLFPTTMRLLRRIGFKRGASLAGALTATLSPLAWLGATQPGDFAPGALGATLLLGTLFQPRQRWSGGYQVRAASLLFLAFLLSPENLLLAPAVVWAVGRRAGRGQASLTAGPMALIVGTSVWFLVATGEVDGRPLYWHLLDTLLAGREQSLAALPLWLGTFAVGLGGALLGLYTLLLGRRNSEEAPPPSWIVPWCLVVLAPVVGGSPAAGPVGGYLLPAAAVGVADWLTRREQERSARRWSVVLPLAHVLLTAVVAVTWNLTDPLRSWRADARAQLEPTDVVIAPGSERRYLLIQRWGLTAFPSREDLPAELQGELALGARRLVLAPDRPPSRTAVLHPELDTWVLLEGALEKVPAGGTWSR